MTKLPEGDQQAARCRWCARPVQVRAGAGRPRRYCRPSCRQQAYIARRMAMAHGLREDDVILGRDRFDELMGVLYCLEAALEDVERDLTGRPSDAEAREALDWLVENARAVAAFRFGP